MSFTLYTNKNTRLQRSELAVPGSNYKMFEKALNSDADYIFLDLEDAVHQMIKFLPEKILLKVSKSLTGKAMVKQFLSELMV